ncbi:helicase-related protein [Streptomyces sp. MS19]|uniref:helicase-related protein n=1 Tax=Streptomyces sp. MS19 TaxID=3385972 RepID=UPI00399FBB25
MSDHTAHTRFRDELVERLRGDLLGPTGREAASTEVLDDWPLTAYATGVLIPRTTEELAAEESLQEDDEGADPPVDEAPDIGIALTSVRRPSATGLTFTVDPSRSRTVRVHAEAAVYDPVDSHGLPTVPRRAERRSTGTQDLRWRRRRLDLPVTPLDVTCPGSPTVPLAHGLELRLRVRPVRDGRFAVTTTLVNTHLVGGREARDAHAFFQVGLRVEVPDGSPALIERVAEGAGEDEVRLNRLLYRHAPSFATGHGCAADWDWSPPPPGAPETADGPAGVACVRTEFVPSHEVPLTESNPDIDVRGLGMTTLATAARTDVVASLGTLLDAYAGWIRTREADLATLRAGRWGDTEYMALAEEQLRLCRTARDRMGGGVRLLARDDRAFEAFRLANEAMALQLGRGVWMADGRTGEPTPQGTWRPFQIGFLLLCLDGLVDPGHEDRGVVDLLWFPTGGGKTEAYLGLIAFTVFHRRLLLGRSGGGVTVLMRYTLRLLTLQQFERAARLMCAMDRLRAGAPGRLGDEPISIGMWVGRSATPNTLKEAEESLRDLAKGRTLQERNPVQLGRCPWCGSPLRVADHRVDVRGGRMTLRCPGDGCPYHTGLPVHVVDEELYRTRPTLVVATADKFARVAWREDVAALFNRDVPGTPPPELVVQDELHLISGPLGTLAGLYEAAVDLAADRPKVIASTATIRRAEHQGEVLFDRKVAQFPPAGLDARDSWFAVQAPVGRRGRRYVGLLTPGMSQASLLIRAYASLLHHAARLEGGDEVRDAYWTLVGYFNSLRLLAAAELQVHADVNERLRTHAAREGSDAPRHVVPSELTSRVASSEIPRRLESLAVPLGHGTERAEDVVLATNMISVGVDIDRLGLMTVMGQPQTTAEYIQATSRVGRRHPGLVVTLFNGARSRDLSHYENFLPYHSALYRQVESSSVTPWSVRARDRALHAAFVGLVRLTLPAARSNRAAGRVESFLGDLAAVRAALVARIPRRAAEETASTDAQLRDFVRHWLRLAEANPDLVYEAPHSFAARPDRDPDTALLRTHSDPDLDMAWPTLWSLRDVDAASDLYLER